MIFEQKAIDFIKSTIPAGDTIIEIGSGDSTTKILGRIYKMYSVEDKSEWCKYPDLTRYIKSKLKVYTRHDDGKENRWYSKYTIQRKLPKKYSCIIIDGPANFRHRLGFLDHIEIFNTDVIMIFHDIDSPHVKYMIAELEQLTGRSFHKIEGSRAGYL